MKLSPALSLGCACLLANSLNAQVSNGGFETDYTDWNTYGLTTIEDANFDGVSVQDDPTEGDFDALLETGERVLDDLGNLSDSETFFTIDDIETELGLQPGDLSFLQPDDADEVIEGSLITQEIIVNAGDTIHFDFNFLTDEFFGGNDLAFFYSGEFGNTADLVLLNDVESAAFIGTDTQYADGTGWSSGSYHYANGGNFLIGFGVVDVFDEFISTGLLVDNVRVEVIPEPRTISLVLGVMFGFLLWLKRRN